MENTVFCVQMSNICPICVTPDKYRRVVASCVRMIFSGRPGALERKSEGLLNEVLGL